MLVLLLVLVAEEDNNRVDKVIGLTIEMGIMEKGVLVCQMRDRL